jgi:proteic killer suppression protein
MIRSFRHRGLRRLYERGDGHELRQDMIGRIRRALSILDSAKAIEDIGRLPGMRLHRLKGDLAGLWSISVSGNWRIVFHFTDEGVADVDLVDYH